MFVIVIESREVKGQNGSGKITKDGEKHLVVNDREGWVVATSSLWEGAVKPNAKIFNSVEDAEKFAKSWGGHPWYVKPKAWEIIEVREKIKVVFDGYEMLEERKK